MDQRQRGKEPADDEDVVVDDSETAKEPPIRMGSPLPGNTPEKHDIEGLAEKIFERGIGDKTTLWNILRFTGRHLNNITAHDIPENPHWSLATLLVRSYLEHVHSVQDTISVLCPHAWRVYGFGDGSNLKQLGTRDLTDWLVSIAAHWRTTSPVTSAHFYFIRKLELELATRLKDHEWTGDDENQCYDILAQLWGMETIGLDDTKILAINDDETDTPWRAPNEDTLWAWVQEEAAITRNAAEDDARHKRFLYKAEVALGEQDAYARHMAGVEAADLEDVVRSERTHVQFTYIEKGVKNYFMEIGSSIAAAFFLHTYLHARIGGMSWATQAMIIDIDLCSPEAKERLQFSDNPMILLYGGDWYVVHNGRTTRTVSVVSCVRLWFDILAQESRDPATNTVCLDIGSAAYSLQKLYDDPTFPFACI